MSKNLEKVIQRAISDAAFRRQLQSNPEAALRGFQLTQAEVAALRSGDAGKLTSLGIDQRMSKTFSFGGADGATRAMTGSDLATSGGSGAYSDRDLRQIGDATTGSNQAVDSGNTSGETRMFAGSAGGSTSALDQGAGATGHTGMVGDPMSESSASSVIGDPENPANTRGFTGGGAADVTGGAGSSSLDYNTLEHTSGLSGNAMAAPIPGSPEEFAFRDQGASTTASNIGDPDNPANARGYIAEQAGALPADVREDLGHAIVASRSDAFLSEGEVSQYSDPSVSSGQVEDEGNLFNPNASDATVDDSAAVSQHHDHDIPT